MMTGNQETAIAATRQSVETLFRSARAMPEDKLAWKPADTARSALEILQECAQAPLWFIPMITEFKSPAFDREKAYAERALLTTLDACEKACRENTERLCAVIAAASPEDQEVEVALPFGENMKEKVRNIMWFHYWNTVYHTGQVNYIQTLYGDVEMH